MERPLAIFIVGTTAVGKTKLSIELCKALGGEVINCDSKQLYKHASIMTAKASTEEQAGIPHHMLSVLELEEACYNRNKYFEEAWKAVEDIKKRGKVPVIIGGTNYYLETLLYNIGSISKEEECQQERNGRQEQVQEKTEKIQFAEEDLEKMSKNQKYDFLKKVDPVMAQKLHSNDQVRIHSFLQRYIETGKPPSADYKPYTHDLRDSNSLLFWLQNSDKNQLHSMMGSRINKMVEEDGLLQILSVFQYAQNHGCLENMGALQSIGYKEFKEVFKEVQQILAIPKETKNYEDIEAVVKEKLPLVRGMMEKMQGPSIRTGKNISLLTRCKEILNKNTIDYSKRQLTWIKNRLFAAEQNRKHFFALDIAGPQKSIHQRFDTQILEKALQIVEQIRKQGFGSIEQDGRYFKIDKHESIKDWRKYKCEQCEVEANGKHEWEEHLKSRKHRKNLSKKERKRNKEKMKEKQKKENQEQLVPNYESDNKPKDWLQKQQK